MAIDFDTLNLEILDVFTNMSPDLYVNTGGLTFSRKVLADLAYPAFVQLLIDPKSKVFAIRASRHDGHRAEAFSKPRKEQKTTICMNNKNVWEPVRKMMEGVWRPDRRYKVTGHLMADKKTMVFVLPEGIEDNFRQPKEDAHEEA